MNDQIYAAALKGCKGEINRDFISKIVTDDKTNTIRKYLVRYGISQLANYLQCLSAQTYPSKSLTIQINDYFDIKQKKVQAHKQNKYKAPKEAKFKIKTGDAPVYTFTTNLGNSGTVYIDKPIWYSNDTPTVVKPQVQAVCEGCGFVFCECEMNTCPDCGYEECECHEGECECEDCLNNE